MREQLTRVRPRLVHRTEIVFQKNTAIRIALQNAPFVGRFHSVVTQKISVPNAQKMRQLLRISLAHLCCGDPAAVGARRTVDGFFCFLGDCFETPFHEIVAFQPTAEAPVLLAPLFAQPLDFDQASNHTSSISSTAIMVE